jgi:hypothetical protein
MSELSNEEIAALPSMTEEDWAVIQTAQTERDAQLAEQEARTESALAKLALLGLTEEEARAVIGL